MLSVGHMEECSDSSGVAADHSLPSSSRLPGDGDCKHLVSEVREKLQQSFHWFELYLGILVAIIMLAAVAYLTWKHCLRKQERDRWRTKDNLEASVDGTFLARLLGDVAYAKNPDYDRMGWVNDVIVHMWPHIGLAASHMVREMADPLLQQNKPKWMSNVSLHTFTLGDIPPRVFGIKVFRNESLLEELLMDLEFSWNGNQKFQLMINPLPNLPVPLGIGHMIAQFLGMRAGVSDLFIRGRLRIMLKPLMGQMPVVGAIKISLLEQPRLSYGLIIQGGDISFLPGLEEFINNVLRNSVLEQYTLPGGYRVPVAPNSGHEMPAGLLYARVIEAQHVPNMDWLSKTDAYVKLFVRGRRKRFTKVVWNDLNPRWNEDFELLLHDPEHEMLKCVLMNKSSFGADEEIGRVEVPLNDLPSGEKRDMWLDIGPPKDKKEKNPLFGGIRAVRKGGRLVKDSVTTAATLNCIERLRGQREPCKLHLQLSFYCVGAAEVKAAQQDQQLSPQSGNHANEGEASSTDQEENARVINMLRGGILTVKIRKGMDMENEDGLPSSARQVRVRVGADEKHTAEADGQEDPDWEEVLEFAIGGDLAKKDDEQIDFEAWDYHWVNMPESLTWLSAANPPSKKHSLAGAGWVEVPLKEVITRRRISGSWNLNDVDEGKIDMELLWLPILEGAS